MPDNLPTPSSREPQQAVAPQWSESYPVARAHEPGEEGVHWRRYIAAVLRYKWLILAVTALGLAGGIGATKLVKPQYIAQAALWIQAQQRGGGGPIRSAQLLETQGWVNLLRSYVVLDEVVRRQHLFVSYSQAKDSSVFSSLALQDRFAPGDYELLIDAAGKRFTLLTAEGSVVDRGDAGDSIGRQIGFSWQPSSEVLTPGIKVRFSVVTPRDAALQLGQDLRTIIDRDGSFLRLELSGTEPSTIAYAVNATAERFVEVAAELKRQKLTEQRKIVGEQLQVAAANLQGAEVELEDFRVATITLPSERGTPLAGGIELTRGPVMSNFFAMRVERDQLGQDRVALERALADADSGVSVEALMVISAAQGSADLSQAIGELGEARSSLRALLYRYTEANPEVRRARSQIVDLQRRTIPALVRGLIAEMRIRENEIDTRIASASDELREIPTRSIEEARLRRDVTIAEALYTRLQSGFEEARLAEASSVPDISILDRAIVPRRPLRDQAKRMLLMAVLGAFGAAVAGAILLDRIDRKLRYPEQVSDDLGLPILGAVPHVKTRKGALEGPDAIPVVESLRGIRLALAHAHGAAGPLVVTISSPGPGDGKSFLAANLALAFADAGHRTLLIDGDVRRGEQHRLMGASRKPGLTDYLNGDASEEEIVQSTSYPDLGFIGGGTRMQSAPELLGSGPMSQLMVSLRVRYGVIIIDSPPLGAGIDPLVLATLTGNLLLVLRTGVTDRQLAEAKLDMLERYPIRVLGAVLNDIRANGQYRYYGYQYYTRGYELEEERGEVEEKPGRRALREVASG